jgi:hypothetical protein
MSLTDPESFGQVVEAPQVAESLLFEKEAESYEEAIQMVLKRLNLWASEEKGDQDFTSYVNNLKDSILNSQDEIERNAAMGSEAMATLSEFKISDSSEAIFVNIQTKLKTLLASLEEGLLFYTVKAIQKFMHENKNELAASLDHATSSNSDEVIAPPSREFSLDESKEDPRKTEQPYTNGTPEKSPDVVHDVGSANDGKTLGGAPTDQSTLPSTDPSVKAEETVVAVVAEVKPQGKSPYRKGEKKDFIWYKDDRSKAPTEVPREQGVAGSKISEFTPSKAKMDMDNSVPREQGVEGSKINEFNPSKAKMELDNPVPREQGVESAPKEFIKFEESSKYQSNLRAVLRAIKESHEN